jgi:hypothetical protein
MKPRQDAPKIPSKRAHSCHFSVPTVFSVLKDHTVCESGKNSKAFNTENTEGTETSEVIYEVFTSHHTTATAPAIPAKTAARQRA